MSALILMSARSRRALTIAGILPAARSPLIVHLGGPGSPRYK